MANTTHNLTRRESLAGIGIAAATAAVPISAIAAVGGDSAAWDEAMLHFKHYEAAVEAFEPHWNRAEEAHMAALKAVPHRTVTFPSGRIVSTENRMEVSFAKWSAKATFIEPSAYDDHKASMALYDAHLAYQADLEVAKASTDFEAVNDRYDALVERMSDARWALMAMPAPNRAALLWKLDYLMEDTAYSEDAVKQPIADMRRLLGS